MTIIELKAQIFDQMMMLEHLNIQAQAIRKKMIDLQEELKKALEAENNKAQ